MNPSQHIDVQIAQAPMWQGKVMATLRALIHKADPEIVEEWKWDTGVYVRSGMVCAVSAFKDHVKINFFKGASLKDPHKLINAGLTAKSHRSIDFYENEQVKDEVLDLIREAVGLNTSSR